MVECPASDKYLKLANELKVDRVNDRVNDGVNDRSNDCINETQQRIISAILENQSITQTELAQMLGISIVNINKNMKKMQDLRVIERIGSDKKGRWKVNDNSSVKNNERINVKVNETQQRIISAISDNPTITQSELAQMMGLSIVHINKNMQKLQKAGIVKRDGPDNGGHWEVLGK